MKIKTNHKQIVKTPNNVKTFYCNVKKILIFKGTTNRKSLKINGLLTVKCHSQHLELLINNNEKLSNSSQKKILIMQKTTISLIKQLIVESTSTICQSLKFVGVGYRAFPVKNFENQLLLLRLGYSHVIYVRVPRNTEISILKSTKLFMFGCSYTQLKLTAAKIRFNKIPEPYKGKGILYENEKIILKEGKKT